MLPLYISCGAPCQNRTDDRGLRSLYYTTELKEQNFILEYIRSITPQRFQVEARPPAGSFGDKPNMF